MSEPTPNIDTIPVDTCGSLRWATPAAGLHRKIRLKSDANAEWPPERTTHCSVFVCVSVFFFQKHCLARGGRLVKKHAQPGWCQPVIPEYIRSTIAASCKIADASSPTGNECVGAQNRSGTCRIFTVHFVCAKARATRVRRL
ncbi:5'(3')-deoxyribonucleotidase, cytosolic type [Anopheles sinensis]|uniref:5'(3')-deoxyribonucleotidase, cytosolic type n=1 Tax=Anopheles sinensis TaxID=74873 RepID=A0A084VQC2_ANOSI|nr:5'(3')-deoxyribonucleotidase, cytosolic type [Anopheles sinensis]